MNSPLRWLAIAAVSILAACAAPKPAVDPNVELPFDQAIAQASDGLIEQARALPALRFALFSKRGVVVDPMLDATSGLQTAATQRFEQLATQRVAAGLSSVAILPFEPANLPRAEYLLTGTLARVPDAGGATGKSGLRLNLSLTDLKSGLVVAQSRARSRGDGVDATPLRYDSDSPVVIRDAVVEGHVATASAAVGTPADPAYLKRLNAAALANSATRQYNGERYQDALTEFIAARDADSGAQLRTLTGVYLANVKLGKSAEAEEAFAKLVAYGIESNQLRVKFLFNPGTTAFWSDPAISGAYAMWLRQIAKAGAAAKECLNVVGHTSHTGTEPLNDALSLQRASAIRQRLAAEAPTLADRTQAQGRGWRENLIGSGTDDAVDALDRRVEFKVVPCP